MCRFLQGDSYSPVGFCISAIPVCKLLQQSEGYRMGALGNWSISRTYSLIIDDLKQSQESYEILSFKKGTRSIRIENYKNIEQQSKLFAEQEKNATFRFHRTWIHERLHRF